jgi:lysophospholipase L1-like esterase
MHMSRSARRWLLAALTTIATTAGLVLGVTTPAQAASNVHYVALGDSYSSGLGAGSYSGGDCKRSSKGYAVLWANANAPGSFINATCSGATTTTVINSQVNSLSATTTLVSITIGGNDAGFANIMTTCVLQGTTACVNSVQSAMNYAQSTLPGRLDAAFSAIKSRAPNAEVVVLNYPRFYVLNKPFCIGLSETSRKKINDGINLISTVLQSAASRHGFTFADVRGYFTNHELCGSSSNWLNSLSILNLSESYHPNAAGQSGGYLPAFTAAA